jgi:hypothetical protein
LDGAGWVCESELAFRGGAWQLAVMEISELMRKAFLIPAGQCAGLGLVLFLAVWWRERQGGRLALVLLGLAWAVCHLRVNANSYLFPPKESADWLVFGGLGLALLAALIWIARRGGGALTIAAALLLLVVSWLALHKLSWLLDRTESSAQREAWTAGFIAAVLGSFAAAEFAARKTSAAATAAGLALFAACCGMALWQLAMPERIPARLFAAAGLAAGAAGAAWLACLLRPRQGMTLPSGMAGWIAGGMVLLLILGCLSRAAGVPIQPVIAAVVTLPLAALVLLAAGRSPARGAALFLAVTLAGGGTAVWLASRDHSLPAVPVQHAAPTGADDTGAYEGY